MTIELHINLDFIIDNIAWKKPFNGRSDDLLSGGLGLKGLQDNAPPEFENPAKPNEQEIRKRAIYNNYRGLLDMSELYYGTYYGPGVMTKAPELIAGEEYSAFCDNNVTLMVQIPEHFDPSNPYIIAAPSSGSRGVYGAIGVVGEWALKKGFAVAYTDKGTGTGYHNLAKDTVSLINGIREDAKKAGSLSSFTAIHRDTQKRRRVLSSFNKNYPNRLAVKHTHSGTNPQKDWGSCVLKSIEFAFYILKKKFNTQTHGGIKPDIITRKNLTVIAAGISNGGLSSIMAAEQDTEKWINGVVVSEPNVTPVYNNKLGIIQGKAPAIYNHSKSLPDYMTLLNLYQPCASLTPELKHAPLNLNIAGVTREKCKQRCLGLHKLGLLKGDTIDEMASNAAEIIRSYGITEEQNILQPSHYNYDMTRSIAYSYVSQYGRFDVTENFAGYSFSAVDENGRPRPLTIEEELTLFSDQSGLPPFGPVRLINNLNKNGPMEDRMSASPATGKKDMNIDGALMLRRIVTGMDEQKRPLTSKEHANHKRVSKGISETKLSGNLKGCPVIIVTGRSDAILPINHTSRAYVGTNLLVEKEKSRLHYYEITNAHHLDTMNTLYANAELCDPPHHFAPLHYYYLQSLELMLDYLEKQIPLPESQVVHPEAPHKHLPKILHNPKTDDLILFQNNTLMIPD